MLALTGFLGGIVLAFRFNVFALLPAIAFGWMLTLWGGILYASSGPSIALRMVLVAVVLQVGYMAGIIFMWVLLTFRRHVLSHKVVAFPDRSY